MERKQQRKKQPKPPKFWFDCSDGEAFVVDWRCMYESLLIRRLFRDQIRGPFPIQVTRNILSKVNYYCIAHYEIADEELKDFDSKFLKKFGGLKTLVGLMKAAYYFKIRSLWNLTCTAIVDMIGESEVSDREILKIFNMKNYLPVEDIEWARAISQWDFEDMV